MSSKKKSTMTTKRSPRSSSASSSVQVVVRLRPLNDREQKHGTLPVVSASTGDKTVTVIKGQGTRQVKSSYKFDNVFTSFSTQEDVFEATLQPIIRDVLLGYESTVFAYGQTGTGKTHTMEGDLCNIQEHGVIPRSAAAIFDALHQNPEFTSSSVHVSLLEIYNEELSDLLVSANNNNSNTSNSKGGGVSSSSSSSKATTKLAIMEGENGPFCRGLSELEVKSAEDLLHLMRIAHQLRHTGETDMNKESSRSHCIFTLRVKAKRKLIDGSVLEVGGKLHCVDLAGSECAKSCGNAGKQQAARERERMNINRSLLTLGRVVKLLKDKSQGAANGKASSVRIPYRDSKLTRILQESLGGRCKTCLIATISPSVTAIEESMSTLNYAQAANGIINKPIATSLMSVGGLDNKSPTGAGGGEGGQSIEHWHEMECRLEYMQSQVEEAQHALARKHIQHQEFVERAEKAELAQQIAERNHQQALYAIDQLETKVEDVTAKLETTEVSLRDTKLVLTATQLTEVSLTAEATALIDTVKVSITDGDRLHDALLQKREEDVNRKAATNDYHKNQMDLLTELLTYLESISKNQKEHRTQIETSNNEYKLNQLELLEEHTSVIEQMKNECSNEIDVLRKAIQGEIVPTVRSITSSCRTKLNAIQSVLKDGDEKIQYHCQSVISKLSENSHRIKEMEHSFEISSTDIVQKLNDHLQESKTSISKVVSDIRDTMETANESRNQHRQVLNDTIEFLKTKSDTSMDRICSLSSSHVGAVNGSIQSIREQKKIRGRITDSLSNLDGFLSTAKDEYVRKLESQHDILTKQHDALKFAYQKQQEMNKGMVENMMQGMKTLIENEMLTVDTFQSKTFTELVTSNEESKSCTKDIQQQTSNTFDHLCTTNMQLSSDVRANFTAQNAVCDSIGNQLTEFETNIQKAIKNQRGTVDTFIDESSESIQRSEIEDRDSTEKLISTVNTRIEDDTHNLLTIIHDEAKKGLSNLQDSTKSGWEYVRNDIIDTIQDDVTNAILSSHNDLSASVKKNLTEVSSEVEMGGASIINEVNGTQETVSAIETHLKVGIDEAFTPSINKHKDVIDKACWLEDAMTDHESNVFDQVQKTSKAVSATSKQLDNFVSDVIRVEDDTPIIDARNVPDFHEELTSTDAPEVILFEAAKKNISTSKDEIDCTKSGSKENQSEPIVVMMNATPSPGASSPNHPILKDRTTNNNDSPSSASSIPSKRRIGADNNTHGKTGKQNNVNAQKRSTKRARVARQRS